MLVPMVNTRKPRGRRGEALVARQRARSMGLGRRPQAVAASQLHVGQTGTVNRKSFSGVVSQQPTRAAGFMGGLQPFRFGN